MRELLDESFCLEQKLREKDTPRKKKLREEKRQIKGEFLKTVGVVKRLRMDMEELEMLNQEQEIWHTGEKEKLMEECMVEMVSLEQRVGTAEQETMEKG